MNIIKYILNFQLVDEIKLMVAVNSVLTICLFLVLAGCEYASPKTIAPFTTDGCSEFPDGTPAHKNLWLKCCVAHDIKYWAGGSYNDRLNADLELRYVCSRLASPRSRT